MSDSAAMRSGQFGILLMLAACGTSSQDQLCGPVEVCGDGIDNDCDGKIDEGCECTPQAVQNCGVGECAGMQECNSGTWGPCYGKPPQPEICDGLDNDCDGVIDNGDNACGGVCPLDGTPGEACDGPDTDLCKEGVFSCATINSLSCSDMTGSTQEICGNGIDDNCDGRIDEYCSDRILVWADHGGSTVAGAAAQAMGTAVGTDGTIYVVGSHDHDVQFGGGTVTFDAGSVNAAFILAYAPAGTLTWHVPISGAGDAFATAIAIDADGSLVVVGNFGGFGSPNSVTFATGTTRSPVGGHDGFVARYSAAGALIAVATFGSNNDDEILGVAIAPSGKIAITGRFEGTSLALGTLSVPQSHESITYFAAELDTNLVPLWARRLEFAGTAAGDVAGHAVAVDSAGNVYVGGSTLCYTNCPTPPTLTVDIGQADAQSLAVPGAGFLISYTSAGAVRWAIAAPPINGLSTLDTTLYATGPFSGLVYFGLNTATQMTMIAAGSADGWLGQYSTTDGSFVWARQFGAPTSCAEGLSASPDDSSFAVQATAAGPVIAGAHQGSATFASDLTLSGDGFGNAFWAGYDTTGALTMAHDGKVGDAPCSGGGGGFSIALAPDGNLVVVGQYTDHMMLPTTSLPGHGFESSDYFVTVFSPMD